jgi:hypothetical protein
MNLDLKKKSLHLSMGVSISVSVPCNGVCTKPRILLMRVAKQRRDNNLSCLEVD